MEVLSISGWIKDATYKGGTLHYKYLDGKAIAYHDGTEFLVQVARGPKGRYKTQYTFKGNLARAVLYYKSINIGNRYKKRLLMPSSSHNPVLARATS